MEHYRDRITVEPGKRGGKPCVRGLRITVYDVLEHLASGMSIKELLSDFPELTSQDILACLAFAADRERHIIDLPSSFHNESQRLNYPN
ncbi:MAG: DUF433 domain-containing protein [Gammaproteobacteria bacterium]|jgi:uncharacterized protein (DUF433 family)|nr:DUF433 domain-containing protein [Gammaproteobacteria bacterium]